MHLQFPHFDPRIKPRPGARLDRNHPLARGQVGCWLLNEGAGTIVNDLSGNGNPGTITGGTWIGGKSGPALRCNGTSDAVNFGDAAALDGYSAMSWCMSVNFTDVSGTDAVWGKFAATAGKRSWELYLGNNDLCCYLSSDGTNAEQKTLSLTNLSAGVWYHIVVTYDLGACNCYINGQLIQSVTFTTANSGIYAGTQAVQLANGYNGYIAADFDALGIYNRALSASEITQLYREPFAMFQRPRIELLAAAMSGGGGTSHSRTISDGIGVTDILGRASTFDRALTDGMGLADDKSDTAAMIRSVAESIGLSDSSSASLEAVRAIAETLGLADEMAKGEGKTISDTLGLVDTVARVSAILRQVSDGLGLSDSAGRVFQALRTVADGLGITDAVTSEIGGIVRIISDSLGMTDSMSRAHMAVRAMTESLGLTDTVVRVLVASRIITDSLGLTDDVVRGAVLTVADSLGMSDEMTAAVAYLRAHTESLGLTDSVVRISAMLRTINENLGLADAVSYQLHGEDLIKAAWAFLLLQKHRY